jgi:hypothetical protein
MSHIYTTQRLAYLAEIAVVHFAAQLLHRSEEAHAVDALQAESGAEERI